MKQVVVHMRDKETRAEVIQTVDISVIYEDNGICWQVATSTTKQQELLEAWITDRAEAAHDKKLELFGWRIKS